MSDQLRGWLLWGAGLAALSVYGTYGLRPECGFGFRPVAKSPSQATAIRPLDRTRSLVARTLPGDLRAKFRAHPR